MKKLLIAAAMAVLWSAPVAASPLMPVANVHVSAPGSDVIEVKHRGHRAYGWSQGRKVGWRGRSMPPGQYKKYRRW